MKVHRRPLRWRVRLTWLCTKRADLTCSISADLWSFSVGQILYDCLSLLLVLFSFSRSFYFLSFWKKKIMVFIVCLCRQMTQHWPGRLYSFFFVWPSDTRVAWVWWVTCSYFLPQFPHTHEEHSVWSVCSNWREACLLCHSRRRKVTGRRNWTGENQVTVICTMAVILRQCRFFSLNSRNPCHSALLSCLFSCSHLFLSL